MDDKVTITDLPEPCIVKKPFDVFIRHNYDQFVASYHEGGVHASGDTRDEAIENLKDMMAGTFEILSGKPSHMLGAALKRQLKVMREHIEQK